MEYVLTFLEGFASFISPCILPLVPVYISYFMGKQDNNKSKALLNSIFFVLGSSLVFILIAVLASSFGVFVAENIRIIKIAFALILFFWGLDYIGLIHIKAPTFSSKIKFDANNLNILKSFLFGILFSVSHTPCTGIFLASAIAQITKEQDISKGIVLMVFYSIGLGIPFIISAVLIDKMKKVFGFIKKHYRVFRIVSGLILIVAGIYLIIN